MLDSLIDRPDQKKLPVLDLSDEGIRREQARWKLLNEDNLDLFVLWQRTVGMGGETLSSILTLANMPGSEEMIRDFSMLSERKSRLEQHVSSSKNLEKWLKDGSSSVRISNRRNR